MADNIDVTAGSGTTVLADEITLGADTGIVGYVKLLDATADGTTRLKILAEDAAHSTGDTGIMLLAVRKDTATALAGTDGDYIPLIVDSTGRLHANVSNTVAADVTGQGDVPITLDSEVVSAQPFAAILEGGITELIGINEQVDQNDYSGSVSVSLGGSYSGEILGTILLSTEDGSGTVQEPTGILYIFDADPSISSGDTSMTAAERAMVIGKLHFPSSDGWESDANGATDYVNTPIAFHAVSTLYFVFKLTSATSFNDGAGDDEQLEFNFWYRRDS